MFQCPNRFANPTLYADESALGIDLCAISSRQFPGSSFLLHCACSVRVCEHCATQSRKPLSQIVWNRLNRIRLSWRFIGSASKHL